MGCPKYDSEDTTRPNYVFPEETIDGICSWNERWTQCVDLCEILGLKWIPFVGGRYMSKHHRTNFFSSRV